MTKKTASKAPVKKAAAPSTPRSVGKRKKVSLKKAVATLDALLEQLRVLPDDAAKDSCSVEGLRKQVEGMVLTMRGACQGRDGQDDFSFPGA